MRTTATTHAAREHARAQAGARAETQQTIPATAAADLPDGVSPDSVVWDETLPAGGYASRILKRGTTLRLTDLDGDGCIQLLVFNADRTFERLNIADTVKVQWNAYPAKGALLLSDMGRALMSVVEDTRGRNDAFCGASSAWSNERKYGVAPGNPDRPNARDRFLVALAKHGLSRRDVGPSITFFKGVRVEADGSLTFLGEAAAGGDAIVLKAEMNVLVVMANCPHVLDPRPDYAVTPVRVTAWRGAPTGPDDPLWRSTPEIERALLNTEDFYRA
jgi:hypothetical protein